MTRRSLGRVLVLWALSGFAFAAGFLATELVFRVKKVPFPHELFGIAAGAAFVFWTWALANLFWKEDDN